MSRKKDNTSEESLQGSWVELHFNDSLSDSSLEDISTSSEGGNHDGGQEDISTRSQGGSHDGGQEDISTRSQSGSHVGGQEDISTRSQSGSHVGGQEHNSTSSQGGSHDGGQEHISTSSQSGRQEDISTTSHSGSHHGNQEHISTRSLSGSHHGNQEHMSTSIQEADMEKMLLDAQHESSRNSSRGSSQCDSPCRAQTPLLMWRSSEGTSSQSDEDFQERRREVENMMKKNADWIWDWSSRPENSPPREFLLKYPKRSTSLSIRKTSVMKKGGVLSADFLKHFLPSLIISHILAIGLGICIGKRMSHNTY